MKIYCYICALLPRMLNNDDIYSFYTMNTTLLPTYLALLETTIRATSRALQYWNMAFKRP